MTRWLLFLGAGVLGGFGIIKLLSRPRETDQVMPTDPSKPTFPSVEVEPGKYLGADAGRSFVAMREAARKEGVSLPLSTAYRSKAWQQRLYDAWIAYKEGRGPAAPMAAKPGRSLHERGIAIDISGINPKASNYDAKRAAWLTANAHKYLFYNTGALFSSPEPWHWAYNVKREGLVLVS